MASVDIKNIKKSYGAVQVIGDLSLSVDDGSFCALLGPSGCGKSTLLRMIAGLEEVSGGSIHIGERDITFEEPAKRKVAMVFQNYALYPHLTVRQNVAFSLSLAGLPKAEQNSRADAVAKMLQLEPLMDRRPAQLSGGQRQRVAIGRALVRDPQVFLFDEPLSNLDALLRVQMRLELAKLHNDLKTTMIYVTHDQVEAMTLADKIVVLKDGQVMQTGAPMELYHEPANLFVAGFLGAPSMNFLTVDVSDKLGDSATVANISLEPISVRHKGRAINAGGKAVLCVRPQYLTPTDSAQGMLHGTVALTERLGSETVINVTLRDGSTIIAAVAEDRIYAPGDEIGLRFDPAQAHLFAQEGGAAH